MEKPAKFSGEERRILVNVGEVDFSWTKEEFLLFLMIYDVLLYNTCF